MEICNPPYKHGNGTLGWCDCVFPGAPFRPECYDYIMVNYNCSSIPSCLEYGGIDIVFHACHSCDLAKYNFYIGNINSSGVWDENSEQPLGPIDLNSFGPNKVTSTPEEYSCDNAKKTIDGTNCCISYCGASANLSIDKLNISSSVIKSLNYENKEDNCIEVFVKLKCMIPPNACHSDVTKFIAFSSDGCCLASDEINSKIDYGYGFGVKKITFCCNPCVTPTPTPTTTLPEPTGTNYCIGACCGPNIESCITEGAVSGPACIQTTESNCYSIGGEWKGCNTPCPRIAIGCNHSIGGVCGYTSFFDDSFLQGEFSPSIKAPPPPTPPPTPYFLKNKAFLSFNFFENIQKNSNELKKSISILSTNSQNCKTQFSIGTTGCCLEYLKDKNTVRAVGDGSVYLSGFTQTPSGCCGKISVFVNSGKIYSEGNYFSKSVKDGDILIIKTYSECDCAKPTESKSATGYNAPECPSAGPYKIFKDTLTNKHKIVLNKSFFRK
jgi:hypothetical protein